MAPLPQEEEEEKRTITFSKHNEDLTHNIKSPLGLIGELSKTSDPGLQEDLDDRCSGSDYETQDEKSVNIIRNGRASTSPLQFHSVLTAIL